MKENYPDWQFIDLNYPLRTTKNISELIIKSEQAETVSLINIFNHTMDIPQNIPNGPQPKFIESFENASEASFFDAFNIVWDELKPYARNNDILFVMEMIPFNKEELNEALTGINNQRFKEWSQKNNPNAFMKMVICLLYALQMKGRDWPLIILEMSKDLNDDSEKFQEWCRNKGNQDLIADTNSVYGYEADIVVYFGKKDVNYVMSRCRSKFIALLHKPIRSPVLKRKK